MYLSVPFWKVYVKIKFQQQREEKRLLAEANKVLFAFYADIEEHYEEFCPDLFLIKDNTMARKYEAFKQEQLFNL